MEYPVWVEVDLDALRHNVEAARRDLGAGVRLLFVVKADAYGHGAREVCRFAQHLAVDMFGVATLHEGIELREAGVRAPILILSPALPSEVEGIVRYDFRSSAATPEFARRLSRVAAALGRESIVHIEVDTGMGRGGVRYEDAVKFILETAGLPAISIEGVYTHFPSSDSEDLSFAREQLERFDRVVARLEERGFRPLLLHASNSAAILNLPQASFEMVRPGLLLYGHLPAHPSRTIDLEPVMSFKSRLVQIKDVPAGEGLSYGRTFVTRRPSRIGVVPVGYGHGYPFASSNRGVVLVGGRRVPVVGRVTMDITLVDLTELPSVSLGDEVVMLGSQGEERLALAEVAQRADTIGYEFLCSIGKRVPRSFVSGRQVRKTVTLIGDHDPEAPQPAAGWKGLGLVES
jgi:alanine racemase